MGEATSGRTLGAGVPGPGRERGSRRDAAPAGSSPRPARRPSPTSAALALAVVLAAAGCAAIRPPVLDAAVVYLADRPVVIFVPGLTGTVLYDREEQRITWGDAWSTILPRDRGRAFAKPIGSAEDRVEVREAILDITLGPFYRYEVYRPIVATLEANGFSRGRDLFLFGYDWRQSNVESARALARFVDEVAEARPVVLICQSNGGYLCRWAARAGDVSLDEAERGVVRLPRARVEAVVFLGTSHAGSVRIHFGDRESRVAFLAEPLIEVDGDHLGVIRSPASHRAILRIIASSGSRSSP